VSKVGDLLNPKSEEQARRAQCLRTNRAMHHCRNSLCGHLDKVISHWQPYGAEDYKIAPKVQDCSFSNLVANPSVASGQKSESELDGRYDPNPTTSGRGPSRS